MRAIVMEGRVPDVGAAPIEEPLARARCTIRPGRLIGNAARFRPGANLDTTGATVRTITTTSLARIATLAATMIASVAPASLHAQADPDTAIAGRCAYSERVIRERHDTILILCDTAALRRDGAHASLDFAQRSWGSMARFDGDVAGDRMTVARVTLRDGTARAATGTCALFRSAGKLSAITCLARIGVRSVAANFVTTRL